MKIKFSSLNSRHGRNKENYIMKRIEIVKTLVLFDGGKKKKPLMIFLFFLYPTKNR
jgi:hypothetical protein